MGADETLFYGGIVIAALALVIAVIFFIIFYIGKIKLNVKFDKEYGEELKPKRRKRD